MEEIWKDIQGYEGLYQVSNYGRIRSFKRMKNNKEARQFKLTPNSTGYISVGLRKNGKKILYQVHRLVAESFIPNPENKPQVNHIDGNKTNNHISNLEWVTASENTQHAYKMGLAKITDKTKEKMSKSHKGKKRKPFTDEHRKNMSIARKNQKPINPKKVICITTGRIFESMVEGAKFYNMNSREHITDCCKYRRKSAGKLPDGTKLKWMYYDDYLKLTEKGE